VFQLVDQFDTPNTVPILQGIVNKTNPGGMLIVNFGGANMAHIDGIRNVLKSSFERVDELDPPTGKTTYLSPLIAAFYRPPKIPSEHGKKYFRCLGRY
jgi:hypothetical protein